MPQKIESGKKGVTLLEMCLSEKKTGLEGRLEGLTGGPELKLPPLVRGLPFY